MIEVDGQNADYIPAGPEFKKQLHSAYRQATRTVPTGTKIELSCNRPELAALLTGRYKKTDETDRALLFYELVRDGQVQVETERANGGSAAAIRE